MIESWFLQQHSDQTLLTKVCDALRVVADAHPEGIRIHA